MRFGMVVRAFPSDSFWRVLEPEPWWYWLLGSSALWAVSRTGALLRAAVRHCPTTPTVVGPSPTGAPHRPRPHQGPGPSLRPGTQATDTHSLPPQVGEDAFPARSLECMLAQPSEAGP